MRPLAAVSVLALACASAPALAAEAEAALDVDQGTIVVTGTRTPYKADATSTATRTPTDLKDVPQSVSVVTEEQIEDQAMQSVADVLRYVPGAVISQGEGHRDQIILRGNSSTADFFVDGIRDDVQYYRGLYNLERVEVLKGPNAMIFGRGGGGGIVNRVTKRPLDHVLYGADLGVDSYGGWYGDLDINQPLGGAVTARLNAGYEEFANHRDFYEGRRIGINPTLAFQPSDSTRIDLSYEYADDERTVDRGVPAARAGTIADPATPLTGYRSTFFGVPGVNRTEFDANVLRGEVRHRFSDSLSLTSRVSYGDYDKFYQNAFAATPVTVTPAGAETVGIEAYNDRTHRENLFNQNDLVWEVTTGPLAHVVLAGFEWGKQDSRVEHVNGFFDSGVATVSGGRRTFVPLGRTIAIPPITFRQGTGYRNVTTDADVMAFYLQDQISIGGHVDLIGGLRHDRFSLKVNDLFAGTRFSRTDTLWSPRLGLVVKPMEAMSLYASWSRSFLPQSGDQFSSLDLSTAALEPEEFENLEVGMKWDVRPSLTFTAALYRLDRSNTRATDPADPSHVVLTGGQRSKGLELGLSGEIRRGWRVSAGYALQDAEIRRTTTAAPAGRKVALVPRHQASLFTRYDFSPRVGAGLGVYHQSKSFTSISNAVILPAFTDTNIMPGAPTTVRGTLRFRF
ncbi:MAG: TonB-dependent siderophore receptor [Alphaproteobacteria bacterium]|nr:MAG: TonB-dependent siderophore receptor [Alphaproteobacteria bacterium]